VQDDHEEPGGCAVVNRRMAISSRPLHRVSPIGHNDPIRITSPVVGDQSTSTPSGGLPDEQQRIVFDD
jgi:hypothetical protein